VSSNGAQGGGYSAAPAISADGRFCAFESSSGLVASDTNGSTDIYVRDGVSGVVVRASVGPAGVDANQICLRPSVSADGRLVAFDSLSNNLVASDNNHVIDVFVRDTQAGTTARVSVDSSGAQATAASTSAAISADGRRVAFTSSASNLVPVDTNFADDVFVHDLQTGATERISVSSSGAQGNAWSGVAAVSSDARYVVFESLASTLVAGDTNGVDDVFVHDRQTGATARVSVSSSGAQSNGASYSAAVSADGRFVLFTSDATNLVPGDTNNASDVFLRDRQTSATTRVSTNSGGAQSNGGSQLPSLSSDGHFVAFQSAATNLVPGDTNNCDDVFARDLTTGSLTRASVSTAGAQGNASGGSARLSLDGRFLAFQSFASNLVAGDTNAMADIFVRDRGAAQPIVFCTAGTTSHGCVPSIAASGTPSASSGSGFTISVSALEGQRPAMLFYGISNAGFTPSAWGSSSSFLCVKSPKQRTGVHNSGGANNACNGTFAIDWNAYIASHPTALGVPFASGQHVYAQVWFRDPPSPKTTMLSNALEFVVAP